MQAEQGLIDKARFYGSVAAMYAVTLLFIQYSFNPIGLLRRPVSAQSAAAINQPLTPMVIKKEIIAGKPTRLTVPKIGTDLIVEEGHYNPADQSWTLSGYNAHFAMPSVLANDTQGNTFIYGHNNAHVFGPLKALVIGDRVQVFTDAGHTFTYSLQQIAEVKPDDTTTFNYEGPPVLTIQTCSGSWHEKRQLFTFKLEKVDKRV
jgi:LPXTG-site transpeptidase (sortase) family protein